MSKKKKIIVLSSMIALLVATAVFNFVLSGSSNVEGVTATTYFSEYKAQRSSSRNEQILELDSLGKQRISDALWENYRPENRSYRRTVPRFGQALRRTSRARRAKAARPL